MLWANSECVFHVFTLDFAEFLDSVRHFLGVPVEAHRTWKLWLDNVRAVLHARFVRPFQLSVHVRVWLPDISGVQRLVKGELRWAFVLQRGRGLCVQHNIRECGSVGAWLAQVDQGGYEGESAKGVRTSIGKVLEASAVHLGPRREIWRRSGGIEGV
jgi:hypothetical protein